MREFPEPIDSSEILPCVNVNGHEERRVIKSEIVTIHVLQVLLVQVQVVLFFIRNCTISGCGAGTVIEYSYLFKYTSVDLLLVLSTSAPEQVHVDSNSWFRMKQEQQRADFCTQ